MNLRKVFHQIIILGSFFETNYELSRGSLFLGAIKCQTVEISESHFRHDLQLCTTVELIIEEHAMGKLELVRAYKNHNMRITARHFRYYFLALAPFLY